MPLIPVKRGGRRAPQMPLCPTISGACARRRQQQLEFTWS
jgi:hypothetical protein